jgi:ketosteroid isomerase-like protein
MSTRFNTPADAEDAYYDAIDECDLEKMMSVWEASNDAACLLPMRAMHHGPGAIRELWKGMLNPEHKVEISVNHLHWSERGDTAIHLLEESVMLLESGEKQPPIYATNVYRRGDDGWRILLHVNSPAPPPPGMMPPMPGG